MKARETGAAQITGPIFLVQEEVSKPDFLFYAPFYTGGNTPTEVDRINRFEGMVYAPFVVKRLMEGTLEKSRRNVALRLTDGEQLIYNELIDTETDFDPEPLFKRTVDIDLYGRSWKFDIWSTLSFRDNATDNQPLTILFGGMFIDSMLILLFVAISRNSRRALTYTNVMTSQLETQSRDLQLKQWLAKFRPE